MVTVMMKAMMMMMMLVKISADDRLSSALRGRC